ncbi:MAG: tetratricopeptide repeat protein [Anaerolineales bacterium]
MNNLPKYLTPLIGREKELTTVKQLLCHPQVRLLTLTGPGGVGKTRLALQAATDVQSHFKDDVTFVSLISVTDPDLVLATIARILGLRIEQQRSFLDHLSQCLQDKNHLLLLDNFEQVIQAGPALVDLLTTCPELKLMVTSREVLHVRGEQEYAVPLLGLPNVSRLERGSKKGLAEVLPKYASVALFLERVRAIYPDFQPNDEEMYTVAKICTHLNGLPLALELAAARMKLFSSQALLGQLENTLPGSSLNLLTNGARDLPARQRTLRHTIQWSYTLLDHNEQQLFRQLSVFSGGFSLSAAETFFDNLHSFGGSNSARFDNAHIKSPIPVLDSITSLLDKSLLQQDQAVDEPRFSMLVMLSEFGREKLEQMGEMPLVQRAHATSYISLAEQASTHLGEPEQSVWLEKLAQEHANLQAALGWTLEQGDSESASRLGVALWPFWLKTGHLSVGLRLIERILAISKIESLLAKSGTIQEGQSQIDNNRHRIELQAELLYGAGMLAYRQYAWTKTWPRSFFEESLKLYRLTDNKKGATNALNALARVTLRAGDIVTADQMLNEALAIQRQFNNSRGIASALDGLSRVAMIRGEYAQAQTYAEECLSIHRSNGDNLGEADMRFLIGNIRYYQNDLKSAHDLFEETAARFKELGSRHDMVLARALLGSTMVFQGEFEDAKSLLQDTLALAQEIDHERAKMVCLINLGIIVITEGQTSQGEELWQQGFDIIRKHRLVRALPDMFMLLAWIKLIHANPLDAIELLSTAAAFSHSFDSVIHPVFAPFFEQTLCQARVQLDEVLFSQTWVKGPKVFFETAPDEFHAAYMDKIEAAPLPPLAEPPRESDDLNPGQAVILEKMSQLVKNNQTEQHPTREAKKSLDDLTPRELEVLRWVAKGLTDVQVAENLVISPRTVHGHLRSIYAKLGVNSRTAAARYAIEKDLI